MLSVQRQDVTNVVEKTVSAVGVFATTLGAAGVAMPADRRYDSVDLLPFLTGEKAGAPHERLYWRSGGQSALRDGKWKLVRKAGRQGELYDLDRDKGEATDLAGTHPAIAARLSATLAAWNKELIEPVFPGDTGRNKSRPIESPP